MRRKLRMRFGSILLTMAMLLSLLPITAGAEGEDVAQVDDTTYTSLQEAFQNADRKTVKLLKDVYLDSTVEVPEGKTVTFDLNGNDITVYKDNSTGRSLYAINNYGDFTLLDSIGNGTITARGIQNLENGMMTIESGKIVSCDSNGGAAVWNEATVTINGGTFETVHVGSASDSVGVGCLNNSGTALVTGGTFNDVNKRTYAVISTGKIEITPSAGKEVIVTGAHGGLAIDSGTAIVNGGMYSSTDYYGLYVSNDGMGSDPMTAAVTVNGGTFDGKSYSVWIGSDYNDPVNSSIAIYGGTFADSLNAQSNTHENAIIIYGGIFSNDSVKEYVAPNYECVGPNDNGKYTVQKMEDKLVVSGSVDGSGNVSGSLEGSFGGNGTAIDDNTDSGIVGGGDTTTNNDVSINLTTGNTNNPAATTTLEVTKETAQSLSNADKLTVKTDAAEVSFDTTALSTIASGADNDVTITVEKTKKSESDKKVLASYEVSVEANGANLLPNSANNGTVTITVPVPQGVTSPVAWYVQNGVFVDNLGGTVNGDKFTFTIDHLSEIYIVDGEITSNVVASFVENGQTRYFDDLAEAIEEAPAGGTVTLLNDATLTEKVNINKSLTIVGGNHIITGNNSDSSVYFEITGGTFNISDVTLTDFGGNVAVGSGTAVFKVTGDSAKFIGNKLTVENFNRAGFDFVAGTFELSNTDIDCANDYGKTTGNKILTKGVKAGYGSSKVTGTLTNVNVSTSMSNYTDWGSGAIEIYNNAEVTINGGEITDSQYGVWVDNHYAAQGATGATAAKVTLNGVQISASADAVLVYGSGEADSDRTASVDINGGTFTGNIAVYGIAATGKESASIKKATITGDVVNENGGSVAVVDSTINGNVPDSSSTSTTIINSMVNNTLTNTTPDGAVALVGANTYDNLHTAIEAAKTGENKTVTLLSSIEEASWNMIWNMEGITLDGDGNTLKINEIQSGQNHDAVFHSLGGNTFKDLIIDLTEVADDSQAQGSRAFSAAPGDTFSNVTIKGNEHIGYGITVGGTTATGETLSIDNCKFENVGIGVYDSSDGGENKVDDLDITNSTFTNCGIVGVIRVEDTTFTGNTVTNSSELSLAITDEGKATVTGNTFQDAGKIWFAGADLGKVTFTQNKVLGSTTVSTDQAKDGTNLNVSKNYWGGGAPGDKTTGTNFTGENVYYLRPAMQDEDLNTYVPSTPDTPSYDSGSSEPSGDYIVSVDRVSGGKVTVNPGRADKGDEVTVTVKPNDGYDLDELVVTDSKGNELELSYEGSGKYTFTMPSGTVDVKATFVKADVGSVLDDFTDVNPDAWYAQAVEFVVEEGLMTGTSATTFAPDTSMSRAMIWTVLAAYNSYNTSGGNPWYAPGQQWAMVNGVSDGTAPNSSITREQLAVMLWRAAGSPETSESLSGYADASSVSDWAVEALAWAVDNGIISGMGGSTLAPQATATRAQVAVMLMQFVDYMEA